MNFSFMGAKGLLFVAKEGIIKYIYFHKHTTGRRALPAEGAML